MTTGRTSTIRTPDQRLRVFVSSTMKELAEERAAARESIQSLRLSPVLFELGARPHPPRDLYSAYLEQSDIFVGIYGREYGWVAPGMDVSGLEDELLMSGDKPKLLYVKNVSDADDRLTAMLRRIADEGSASYKRFTTADELRGLLADDLALLLSERFGGAAEERQDGRRSTPPLPSYPTALVGREDELREIEGLLDAGHVRLLTLTGPGGTGKTRLGVESARRLAPHFPDGARFVPLEAVRDPSQFPSALAFGIGVFEFGPVRLLDTLKAQLHDRRMLLVLDNFEQIIDAAPDIAELIRDLPHLTLLVTSREPLGVYGEHELPVTPLPVPKENAALAALAQVESIRLFAERAAAVRSGFELTEENREAVADICRRLDGLPLAIELAAAQSRILTPRQICERLADGLEVLRGGPRDLPERQRTMRATIAWSYRLLDDAEKQVFARLGVFAGGFTLEAANAVCEAGDILDHLAALTAKSLLRPVDSAGDQPRFAMLELIRDFAADLLEEAGELEAVRDRHAQYYADWATKNELLLVSPQAVSLRDEFEQDYPNLRLALQHATARIEGADYAPEAMVRLLYLLYFYWYMAGRLTEGHDLSQRALQATAGMPESTAHAAALFALAAMTLWQGDFADAATLADESVGIWRKYDRPHDLAIALLVPSLTSLNCGHTDVARRAFQECIRLLRDAGDRMTEVVCLLHLGDAHLQEGDEEAARRLYQDGVDLQQTIGPGWPMAALENDFGELERWRGNHEAAAEHYRRALEIFEAMQSYGNIARAQCALGYISLRRGDVAGARDYFGAALDTFRRIGNRRGTAECLQGFGSVAAATGDGVSAARLFGASGEMFRRLGARPWPADLREAERDLVQLREKTDADIEAGMEAGHSLSVDEAVALATTPAA